MDPEAGNGAEGGIDIDAAVSEMAGSLGLDIEDTTSGADPEKDKAAPAKEPAALANGNGAAKPGAAAVPSPSAGTTVRAAPKSWAKEHHEAWGKLDPKVQEYIEQREQQMAGSVGQFKGDADYGKSLRETIAPYSASLRAQGINEQQAVGYLLNAHYQLTSGTAEQRAAAYRQIGVDLGLVKEEAGGEGTKPVDPAVQDLQKQVGELRSTLTAEQQAKREQIVAKNRAELDAFASDPANAHFNDVAQDMVPFVKAGMSLKDAYERAVWANPVTRAKEMDRELTVRETKLKDAAKAEGQAARRATATNVRGSDAPKAPTEPQGSMDDTMHETLKKIRARS